MLEDKGDSEAGEAAEMEAHGMKVDGIGNKVKEAFAQADAAPAMPPPVSVNVRPANQPNEIDLAVKQAFADADAAPAMPPPVSVNVRPANQPSSVDLAVKQAFADADAAPAMPPPVSVNVRPANQPNEIDIKVKQAFAEADAAPAMPVPKRVSESNAPAASKPKFEYAPLDVPQTIIRGRFNGSKRRPSKREQPYGGGIAVVPSDHFFSKTF